MADTKPKKGAPVRLQTVFSHKKDIELYTRVRENPAYESASDAELLRTAFRELDRQDAFTEMLNNFEKRIGGSMKAVHRRLDQLDNQNQIVMTMLEVFMRTYYFHTLPVPAEARATAAAEATRRSDKFVEDVASLLQKGGAAHQISISMTATTEGHE